MYFLRNKVYLFYLFIYVSYGKMLVSACKASTDEVLK